jgi:hypothetical protein
MSDKQLLQGLRGSLKQKRERLEGLRARYKPPLGAAGKAGLRGGKNGGSGIG